MFLDQTLRTTLKKYDGFEKGKGLLALEQKKKKKKKIRRAILL